jgi:FkbM family methyltransferase
MKSKAAQTERTLSVGSGKLITRVARLFLGLAPFVAPKFAKMARTLCSLRWNERFAVPATLGLRKLSDYPVSAKSLAVNLWIPAKIRLSLNDYTQASSYFGGLPPLCVTLMEHATERSLFFDIGANVGLISIAMANVLPASAIHAFEANPFVYRVLKDNFRENCPAARAHNVAVSNKSGYLELNTIHNDSGSGSLDPARFVSSTTWHGQRISPEKIKVPTTTLSEFVLSSLNDQWDRADKILIKIDVEGHELQVLQGMEALFSDKHKSSLCVVECANENIGAVGDIFAAWGFSAHRPCWNGELATFPHHTDLVFRR